MSIYSLVILAIACIFRLDLMLPLGVAVWLLYIPPLLLSLWKLRPASTYFFTASCSVLILLAYFNITVWENNPDLALLNRFMAIAMLWLTVFFALRYKRALAKIEILAAKLSSRAADLESANSELEAFSYTVSHDLRKPLSGIIGYCQILLEQCAVNPDNACREDLGKIYDGSLRMDQLIDTLLRFSLLKDYSLSLQAVDLTDIAKEIAVNLQQSQPDRAVTFVIAEGLIVQADSGLMRVVLDNLLGNAWKYTSRTAEVKIELGVKESGLGRVCFVRDNGVGFSMNDADKLFDPFQRLHSEYAGSGIGLATVKRIINRHGGVIWVDGAEGSGATFSFSLGKKGSSPGALI
jgi:light-regulated signal transduction histidine kinase (bacteriophytochrome)